jgi:hypothetical protein
MTFRPRFITFDYSFTEIRDINGLPALVGL